MTTLITGATGSVGRRIIPTLIEHGTEVRALSRNAASAGLPDGVRVVEGALDSAPAETFEGVDSIFLFPASEGVDEFVERAVTAGVSRFVVLSSLAVSGRNARDAGSATAIHHRSVEEAVTSRTDDWTILRPGNFANNLLFWAFPIRSGFPVRIPYPSSSQVLIHEADVAAAATHALTEADQAGRIYELTGPASTTKIEQLAAISAAVGRELPYVEVTPDEFRSDMAQYMDASIIDMLLRYWSETVDEPEVALPSPFGVPARPLERLAEDHRSDFTAPVS